MVATTREDVKVSNDYAMLGSALILSVLAVMFRPETKALVLILACSLVFAYLLKPLGLVIAATAVIFISAYGGHEFKWKEVTILAIVLVIFSVLVFVKGLTLPSRSSGFVEYCPPLGPPWKDQDIYLFVANFSEPGLGFVEVFNLHR